MDVSIESIYQELGQLHILNSAQAKEISRLQAENAELRKVQEALPKEG